jgi:aminoglycoside phosphotransferase (APT) family kinase protein
MLTRPADLPDLEVMEALRTGWALEPVDVEYLPVGFGSHHWRAVDDAGGRWFVSVDDLAVQRRSADDSPNDAYERLRAALLTGSAVHDSGAAFVVAPVRTTDGDVVQRTGDQYAAALYPFVEGRHHEFGDTLTQAQHDQVLRLIGALHTSSAAIWGVAQVEDFMLPQRDELAHALGGLGKPWDTGPYGQRARSWFAVRANRIEHMVGEHDRLAEEARQRPDRMVLTHGEPHPGNLIETTDGWMLVDWDTALVAPPERDLWLLRGAESSTFDAYTGVACRDVLATMLDLYRLTWELGDIASLAARFHRAHGDTADARFEWATMEHRSL